MGLRSLNRRELVFNATATALPMPLYHRREWRTREATRRRRSKPIRVPEVRWPYPHRCAGPASEALRSHTAVPPIDVEVVTGIERGPAGKVTLIKTQGSA